MDNYKRLKEVTSYLQDDYKKLTDFEALSVAAALINSEIVGEGLLVNNLNAPVALEAIAMVLGYEKGGGSILRAIESSQGK